MRWLWTSKIPQNWVHLVWEQFKSSDSIDKKCSLPETLFIIRITVLPGCFCLNALQAFNCSWHNDNFWKLPFTWGFPGGLQGKASGCNEGDPGSIPESGRSPGEGNGNLLQDSCLENSMDRGAWEVAVYGVAKSDMTERLHFHFHVKNSATCY